MQRFSFDAASGFKVDWVVLLSDKNSKIDEWENLSFYSSSCSLRLPLIAEHVQ